MSTTAPNPPVRTIAIIGGGFAGTTLAKSLHGRMPAGWQLLLISEESYTTFNPMLPEVVGAGVFPEHVVAPIREMLPGVRFVMGAVSRIDKAAQRLTCDTLHGPLEFAYDHLVLALGQRARLDLLPGMAEHALPLKLVGDAMHIRNRVLQALARVELCDDATQRLALAHFVVVGGGFSGVEVAGALADFVKSASRHYPRTRAAGFGITLLHDGDRLLPELPPALGDAAERSLSRRGVHVRCGTRAARIHADAVELSDGQRLPSATVVCTVGTRPNPLVEALALSLQRGRIATEADGRVRDEPALWALGDCAAQPNARDGLICPPTAQFAVAQAKALANNLLLTLRGQPTKPFAYAARGMMATTGHLKGVALLFGLRLSGLPAWLLWRGYYLLRMPTLGRKTRIWVEWTWGLFFPLDITHLRFTRTTEVDRGTSNSSVPK
ncbi:NADH dehydrogenase [Pelomonas sp. Root1217]|uniref:NAD(P)/FAD-dependent oxidoreductase n=1 Tax=Pelomonas sp. Root1217 TaxID=1736430 RepID=UPI00070C7F0D|nr:FAD-dependent oxidoreductase [Pelomonas sp. Root1217]KQV49409.1 NADH dehydrogenase [Pelomonas sp. Root1217]